MQARQRQQQLQRQDEVLQWERDWRTDITANVKDIAATMNATVGVVREMQADVKELMEWRASLEQRQNNREDSRRQLSRWDIELVIMGLAIAITLLSPHLAWR